jgi:glutamate/tyrosine decarboxylase-like PLP-dependent enzyme
VDQPDWKGSLGEAFDQALAYLEGLPARPLTGRAGLPELRAALGGPLPERPLEPREVVADLATAADPGVVASGSGRFFGFVVGGATPAALAADWLASAWDLAADGLWGAPRVRVLAGRGRHGTIDRALRFLGVGTAGIVEVDADDQGRMRTKALAAALERGSGPAIVCAQVGGVNSGAVDPVGELCRVARGHGAWVHVDGAAGLWAAASPRLRPLVAGVELADSWATDAHKWLNVPYDSGLVFCAHPDAHRGAMGVRAGYLVHGTGGERDALDWTPEHSRRARGFAVYAAVRSLGRLGVAELVERCCALAGRFAERLAAADGVEVCNQVVLNQVLVRFRAADGDHDAHTRRVVERVQQDGTCWLSGTTWQGRAAMRVSVSNWSTDEADVDRSVAAILRCARE